VQILLDKLLARKHQGLRFTQPKKKPAQVAGIK